MKRTGLCPTCGHDRYCVLTKAAFVWDCGEFFIHGGRGHGAAKSAPASRIKSKQAKEPGE